MNLSTKCSTKWVEQIVCRCDIIAEETQKKLFHYIFILCMSNLIQAFCNITLKYYRMRQKNRLIFFVGIFFHIYFVRPFFYEIVVTTKNRMSHTVKSLSFNVHLSRSLNNFARTERIAILCGYKKCSAEIAQYEHTHTCKHKLMHTLRLNENFDYVQRERVKRATTRRYREGVKECVT